jgi:hypothetical protein
MISDSLLARIDKGREGGNQGLSIGLNKLESIIDGLTQSTYYLLFSQTGSGKTTLALYSFIYYPLKEHLEDGKYRASIFSLEMEADILYAKLLLLYLWDTYHIDLSLKELLSRKKDYYLEDSLYEKVKEGLLWLKKVEEVVTIYDKSCNAKFVYKALTEELSKRGKFVETESRKIYIPDNPDLIHVVMIDHMSLLRPSDGKKLKEEIDLTSAYLVTFRNRCKISPVVIMQVNRDSSNMDRRKAGLNNLTLNDTKDSGNVAQDCEVALSLFNPFKEELASYHGYNIKELRDRFRSITVRKSRFGESEIEIGCFFWGHNGYFKELPKAEEIFDYSKFKKLDYEIVEDKVNENNLNYAL